MGGLANIKCKTAGFALAISLLLMLSTVFPMQALADDVTSVSTATATASYSHPNTGEIEDSGGESSEVLGEAMVDGINYGQALVEVDETGTTYVTLRFLLYSYLSDVSFSYDSTGDGSSYTETEYVEMQSNEEEDTGDYRFAIDSTDSIICVSLFPEPMGRDVVFFVTLSDLVDGNTAGFVETVVPGVEIESSSGTGISTTAIVAAVVIVVVIIIAVAVYFVVIRPKKAKSAEKG